MEYRIREGKVFSVTKRRGNWERASKGVTYEWVWANRLEAFVTLGMEEYRKATQEEIVLARLAGEL